jgi:Spy/CpxP family protein refolding chaperone
MISMRRIAVIAFMAAFIFPSAAILAQAGSSPSSSGQQASDDKDIDLLRKDIRSQKKQLIAANLNLTDKEAEKFWPIYDQYTAELAKINDAKYAAIQQYAQNYQTMSDDQAEALTRQVIQVDSSVAELRQKYMPIFAKALSGKKTALFFQLDHRLLLLIDLQLSSVIPLVEP